MPMYILYDHSLNGFVVVMILDQVCTYVYSCNPSKYG